MAMITLHSFFYFAAKMTKVSGTDLLHLLTQNVKNKHMMNSKNNCLTSWQSIRNKKKSILCFYSWWIHRQIEQRTAFSLHPLDKLHNLDHLRRLCEEFYEIPNFKCAVIVTAIKDAFIRFQLSFSSRGGQIYDGASNMMGVKSGVATQSKAIQLNVLETHCHTHSVSLAVKETTTKSKVLRDTLDTVREICVLIKFSPKR